MSIDNHFEYVTIDGDAINFDAAYQSMDIEICAEIHGCISTKQVFVDRYCAAHFEKYKVPFSKSFSLSDLIEQHPA